jgi:hypothetical protein
MNIVKDDNWYTVYNKDDLYIKCYQDKIEAQHVAQEIGGRYTITKHWVGIPSTADGGDTYFKRDDSIIYLLCLFTIIIIVVIFLIF